MKYTYFNSRALRTYINAFVTGCHNHSIKPTPSATSIAKCYYLVPSSRFEASILIYLNVAKQFNSELHESCTRTSKILTFRTATTHWQLMNVARKFSFITSMAKRMSIYTANMFPRLTYIDTVKSGQRNTKICCSPSGLGCE